MISNLSSPLQRVISNSKSLSRLLFDLSLIANFSCSDSRARRCSAESASICRSRAEEYYFQWFLRLWYVPEIVCCRSSALRRQLVASCRIWSFSSFASFNDRWISSRRISARNSRYHWSAQNFWWRTWVEFLAINFEFCFSGLWNVQIGIRSMNLNL